MPQTGILARTYNQCWLYLLSLERGTINHTSLSCSCAGRKGHRTLLSCPRLVYICKPLFTVQYRTTMPVKAPSAASTWHHPCLSPSSLYDDKVVTLSYLPLRQPPIDIQVHGLLCLSRIVMRGGCHMRCTACGCLRRGEEKYTEVRRVAAAGAAYWVGIKRGRGRGYVEEPAARVSVVLMAGASMNIVPPGRRRRSLLAGHPKHRCYKSRTKRHQAPCRTTSKVPVS
jgi:hypothetical protein